MSKLSLVQEEGFVTDKQLNVLNHIEHNTGIEFKGFTRLDAKKFISENIEKSKTRFAEKVKESIDKGLGIE